METRGVVAHYDRLSRQLVVWDSTQAPIPIRNGLAAMFGLSERQVRVVAPFIGGGFGPKIMMFYPEETLVPWAAMKLGQRNSLKIVDEMWVWLRSGLWPVGSHPKIPRRRYSDALVFSPVH